MSLVLYNVHSIYVPHIKYITLYIYIYIYIYIYTGFHLGGHLPPLLESRPPPPLEIRLAIFFQGVIGCNEYRTEIQHKEYTA